MRFGAEADVLVVGAGLAGANAARTLADAGCRVQVFDKGRGPGGRLSTRRTANGAFDHGASSLQAVGDDFRRWLDEQSGQTSCAPWIDGHWVGVPGMSGFVAHSLAHLAPRWATAVANMSREAGLWQARDAASAVMAEAPWLVLAVPAPQARAILAGAGALNAAGSRALRGVDDALARVRYSPCWAALVQTDADASEMQLAPIFRPLDGVLERVVRESSKPGRVAGHWVLHATAAWSEQHLEQTSDEVAPVLLDAFSVATGIDLARIKSLLPHRWRYSIPTVGSLIAGAPEIGLYLAGDAIGWDTDTAVPAAERAWRSGRVAAQSILLSLGSKLV